MNRIRIAASTAVVATALVLGAAPVASAAPARVAASACVTDLQAAQTSNNAAISADQLNNTSAARTANLSTATSLLSAVVDCLGQPSAVTANVLTATTSNAAAVVFNLLGASAAALDSERSTASALTQALANAS
ncbi:hypothetical protein MUU72_01155 [Streptomyces sp. RS10V-4]|uniref:hypothetical protein n=1 Tax=Streptomyces rhizoryzae TaxID=2932493 RepID=UPI0020049891|nr:hypothetical protein [Streptomyces rhizoryzae]MCK7621748.1 hypothetical protein [Streptomyces rhizoryzae]